jgi:hypothetical protein
MRLVTVVIAFVLGAVFGMIATVLFLTDDYSYHKGELNAQVDLGTKIPDLLGRDVDPREPMVPFFSAKTESVVVVTVTV